MLVIKSEIVWIFILIHVCSSERRIEEGIDVQAEKNYVVYLVKAPLSDSGYDFWLCGGALVTSEFVVTSAACIKDVEYLYVIAGYKKYVVDDEIETDACTSQKKKKVIYTCYPEAYELRYDRLDKWSLIDIGIARVESPYDFQDQSFKTLCSYIPGTIGISYNVKDKQPKNDAVVFGWGHTINWRKDEDPKNYNQETLKYAPVMIIDKEECKDHYEQYGRMKYVIDKYMICTLGAGQINDFGDRIDVLVDSRNGNNTLLLGKCAKRKSWVTTNPEDPIDDCDEYEDFYDKTRRGINEFNPFMTAIRKIDNSNKTRAEINRTTQSNRAKIPALMKRTTLTNNTISFKNPSISNKTGVLNETVRNSRRYGICQNDHGGPLVTWVGAHEVLIGVASVFKVADDMKCIGPFLYTSTQCNGAFLHCIISQTNFDLLNTQPSDNRHTRSFCKKSEDDERHPTMERHISWILHPAGPADHEKNLKKPEIKQSDTKARGSNEAIVNESENPFNKKPSVIVDHAPNKFKINDVQNHPNTNEKNAPNKNYGATLQHGPLGTPMVVNDKYTPNKARVLNSGPAQVSMTRFELSYKPKTIYKYAQNNKPAHTEPEQNNNEAG